MITGDLNGERPPNSTKTTISQGEYHQLVGLQALAASHNKMLYALKDAALGITGEIDTEGRPNDCGHTADLVFGENLTVYECLRRIGITVIEDEDLDHPNIREQALAVAIAELADNTHASREEKIQLMRALASSSYRRITGKEL